VRALTPWLQADPDADLQAHLAARLAAGIAATHHFARRQVLDGLLFHLFEGEFHFFLRSCLGYFAVADVRAGDQSITMIRPSETRCKEMFGFLH
jgi:hypothetical protein